MNEYEMIVLVVFIIAIAAIVIAAITSRRATPVEGGKSAAANRRLTEEMQTLKQRIAVLERIATDKDHRLELEFERLRDG